MNRFRHSPIETLGYGVLLLYLFLYVSRVIVEFLLSGMRIQLILTVVFLLCAMISGRLALILRSRLGWLIAIFTVWVGVCVPFSVWRGGSARVFLEAFRSLLVLFSIVGLTSTTERWLKLTGAIGFAIAVAAVSSLFKGDFRAAERLALEGGTLGDPNFYCWYLIISLPILWGISRNAVTRMGKIGALLLTIPVWGAAVATGSRSGFIAAAAMMAVFFFRSSAGQKVRLAVATMLFVLVVSMVFSGYIIARYTTLFGVSDSNTLDDDEVAMLGSAAGSTESRIYLFWRSVEFTVRNPLFGVGPGQFQVAEADDAVARGLRGAWHETHNTYTQISSETGILGGVLFIAALVMAYRTLTRIRKTNFPATMEHAEEVRVMASYLQLSFVATLVGALFLSVGYGGLLFVFIGLAASLQAVVERELAPATAAPPVAYRTGETAAVLSRRSNGERPLSISR
jgi:O-antigen ligase